MKQPCEDDGSEESIDVGRESLFSGIMKGSFVRCGSPTTATQSMARKKRRGVIEKRRRDRINNSLSELRRLVPTAFEKQGSAKLEKAEILQMTVDHLKMLQVTGRKGYHDAQVLSLDFLSLGFRECVSEVSRYLSAVEGVDSGDPLWRRLVSHLSCCASQCDAATLMAASHPVAPHHWAAVSVLHPPPYGTGGGDGASHMLLQRGPSHSESTTSPYSYSSSLELPCPPTPISASFLSLSASFPIIFHGGVPHSCTLPPPSSPSCRTPHSSRKPYRPWRPGGLGDL